MALWPPLRHLLYRPALTGAIGVGVAAGFTAPHISPELPPLLVGWLCGIATYLIASSLVASRASADDIRRRADLLDEGGLFILFVVIGATAASIAVIVTELSKAKSSAHAGPTAVFAAVTVALSWMFLHVVFAFHYAHAYYSDDEGKEHCLDFPGTDAPLYWDFIYFSFIAGMTTQVADVITKSSSVRKLVLGHSVISFFFNTTIIALGVNIAASLVG